MVGQQQHIYTQRIQHSTIPTILSSDRKDSTHLLKNSAIAKHIVSVNVRIRWTTAQMQQQQQQEKHTSERHRLNSVWIPNVRFEVIFEIVSVRGPTGKKTFSASWAVVPFGRGSRLFLVKHTFFTWFIFRQDTKKNTAHSQIINEKKRGCEKKSAELARANKPAQFQAS